MNRDDESKKSLQPSGDEESSQIEGAEPDLAPVWRRRWYSGRWVLPAIYLTAAALIIVFMYGQTSRLLHQHNTPQAAPVATQTIAPATQPWTWPVAADTTGVHLIKGYYDATAKGATVQALAADLVHYDDSYQGNTGIDIGIFGSHRSFGVVAAASGVVKSVTSDPVMGETVVINANNGYETFYQSLGSVSVKPGDQVQQGQLIGSSGYNMREAALGNHLYFAVQKDNTLVDPESVLPQTGV